MPFVKLLFLFCPFLSHSSDLSQSDPVQDHLLFKKTLLPVWKMIASHRYLQTTLDIHSHSSHLEWLSWFLHPFWICSLTGSAVHFWSQCQKGRPQDTRMWWKGQWKRGQERLVAFMSVFSYVIFHLLDYLFHLYYLQT